MKTLPASIVSQKNMISTPGSWLVCVDIAYPNLTASPRTHYRFVNNTEDVVLDGNTYTKWAFGLGQVKESIKGELPRITLSLYDVNLTMKATLQANDGWSGGEVSVRRVYVSLAGVVTDTDILQYFTILSTTWDDRNNAINFNIGVSTPLSKRFPRDRYVSTICRHKFRDGFCRYGETVDAFGNYDGLVVDKQIALYSAPAARDYIRFQSTLNWNHFDENQFVTISGSVYNDNTYRIETKDDTSELRLYLYADFRFDRSENSLHALTLTVTTQCNHSLTQCRANNNSHKYGASPGVSEGHYG